MLNRIIAIAETPPPYPNTRPETIQCYSVKQGKIYALNKYALLGTLALLKTTARNFLLQQSKAEARAMRKQLRKEFTADDIIFVDSQLSPSETISRLVAVVNNGAKKQEKNQAFRELYIHNQFLAQLLRDSLQYIGVNDYERHVALCLAEQYYEEALTFNIPILKNGTLVKEFDGIACGEKTTLIEEKRTLNKRHLRGIFADLSDQKSTHLSVINDETVCQQNGLPQFERLQIVFSELDDSLVSSQKRKLIDKLTTLSAVEIPADKFISMFEGDVTLPNAKQLLRSSGIKTIRLTQLKEENINLDWWIL